MIEHSKDLFEGRQGRTPTKQLFFAAKNSARASLISWLSTRTLNVTLLGVGKREYEQPVSVVNYSGTTSITLTCTSVSRCHVGGVLLLILYM